MKILWLDTETTGLYAGTHGLREIGYIIEIDGIDVERGVLFIDPRTYNREVIIDPYALEISGKTIDCFNHYDDSKFSYDRFLSAIQDNIDVDDKNDRFVIAGYNVGFDIGFIKDWFKDIGSDSVQFKDLFHYKSLDVFALVFSLRVLGKIGTENDKLETICNHFGISIDAHDALSDIVATKQLFEKLNTEFIK